ncbi:MAG: hypothetical protein JO362_20300 [Streptomycetaceae bacterium]|nr:hypothetical protein [Streptomycetaceae bacterium]
MADSIVSTVLGRLTGLLNNRSAPRAPLPPPRTAAGTPEQPSKATMDRRSWYMPRESADALSTAVEELHQVTRKPKHAVMAALVAVALDHLSEVEQRVTEHRAPQ